MILYFVDMAWDSGDAVWPVAVAVAQVQDDADDGCTKIIRRKKCRCITVRVLVHRRFAWLGTFLSLICDHIVHQIYSYPEEEIWLFGFCFFFLSYFSNHHLCAIASYQNICQYHFCVLIQFIIIFVFESRREIVMINGVNMQVYLNSWIASTMTTNSRNSYKLVAFRMHGKLMLSTWGKKKKI